MFDLITKFFKKYDVHLSPTVHGSVRNNGVPLENVEVYRSLDYDKNYGETTRTDSNGQFSFPEKIIKSRRPGQLFDETRIRQVIGLVYEGEKYLLWYLTGEAGPYRAITEKLGTLNCDLSTSEEVVVFKNLEFPSFNHAAATICRWN
ncbi:carboxypeptidase-like regulatory domain-containing protein [Marinobacter salexigens]|uniref:Carboxypeptidase-like regulatory domain-containing protein n=1 Tax=Marinobacter salexigens TaxID=1925763 RepID=A0ABS6A657_9GAMM|nr:carboxypeptidase-like regulatory domain-containing protein [Marinobacter salexigens]MBU2873583.1 carboxypeptidase-like regulatory domain-containing protein [Marinobacter salexigens]